MSAFARLKPEEQLAAYQEAAVRKHVLPVIVEKDFWVCWLLGRIFATPVLRFHYPSIVPAGSGR